MFKPMQLIKVKDNLPVGLGIKKGDLVLFLGEIPNMPGHCAIAPPNGPVTFGWHLDNFEEPGEDDI